MRPPPDRVLAILRRNLLLLDDIVSSLVVYWSAMFSAFNVYLLLACFLLPIFPAASSQTLAERLGYAPGTKLIIVHADDLGETHAVNAAATKAMESGPVNSQSLKRACTWFTAL